MNITIITGRLTRDPELRKTPSGKSVTTVGVAVDRGYGDNKTAVFFDVVLWEHRAEYICRYGQKGRLVEVQGEMQTRDWQTQSGNHKVWELVASNITLLDRKPEPAQQTTSYTQSYSQPPQPQYNARQVQPPQYTQDTLYPQKASRVMPETRVADKFTTADLDDFVIPADDGDLPFN